MKNIKQIEKPHNSCDITFQSVELVLRFIHHITHFKNDGVIELYPQIIVHILQWAQYSDLFHQTVSIFQTIFHNIRINKAQNLEFEEKLKECLNVS